MIMIDGKRVIFILVTELGLIIMNGKMINLVGILVEEQKAFESLDNLIKFGRSTSENNR